MAKYGKKASEKVDPAMHERRRGKLKSGGSAVYSTFVTVLSFVPFVSFVLDPPL